MSLWKEFLDSEEGQLDLLPLLAIVGELPRDKKDEPQVELRVLVGVMTLIRRRKELVPSPPLQRLSDCRSGLHC
jgi:hypothetical protein